MSSADKGAAPIALARAAIRALSPYSSARSEAKGATGIASYLDANESPWPPVIDDTDALARASAASIHRYPEPQPPSLVARFSQLYGVAAPSIFIGRGTDDAIDALFRVFCEAGRDRAIICPPTYGMYRVSAGIQGAAIVEVPLLAERGFQLDMPALVDNAAEDEVKLIFVCSPNNPTGNAIAIEDIAALCRAVRAVVVVDEAYIDFCPEKSAIGLLGDFANLVVLRTLSKAWALAGARCGVALGHPAIIELLHRVRAPYPISQPAVVMVERALSATGQAACQERTRRLIAARGDLTRALAERGDVERVFPSEANFLLVRVRDAESWLAACRDAGILIRDRRSAVPGCVRITVGSPEENAILLRALPEDGQPEAAASEVKP